MVDRDEFKRLVESGMRGSDIARTMGVTRQRVSQLCRQMGLETTWYRSAPMVHEPPIGAVITNTSLCGKASELFVAADLTAKGWYVFLPVYSNRDVDLIARRGDTLMLVEVRTLSKNRSPLRKGNFTGTHHAFVRNGHPVLYEPPLE
jgi:hypothetical protein